MADLRVVRVKDRFAFLINRREFGLPNPWWGLGDYESPEEAQEAAERVVLRLSRLEGLAEDPLLH